jgi:hypothetical protein
LEDDVEELNEQLAKEEERADLMSQDLDDATARADDLDGEAQGLLNELRVKSRELETARASSPVVLVKHQLHILMTCQRLKSLR